MFTEADVLAAWYYQQVRDLWTSPEHGGFKSVEQILTEHCNTREEMTESLARYDRGEQVLATVLVRSTTPSSEECPDAPVEALSPVVCVETEGTDSTLGDGKSRVWQTIYLVPRSSDNMPPYLA
jgi:hypothetical protein